MSLNKSYAVFGLGRYGAAVAKELVKNGADVLAVDIDENIVNAGLAKEKILLDYDEYFVIGDNAKFLKEGLEVESLNIEGQIVGIDLPEKVSYKVISAPDAVKGNTTSGAQKDVTIETGFELKAPLFISEGDEIVITTRDGKYFSRG